MAVGARGEPHWGCGNNSPAQCHCGEDPEPCEESDAAISVPTHTRFFGRSVPRCYTVVVGVRPLFGVCSGESGARVDPTPTWQEWIRPRDVLSGSPATVSYVAGKPQSVLAEDKVIGAWDLGLDESDITIIPVADLLGG